MPIRFGAPAHLQLVGVFAVTAVLCARRNGGSKLCPTPLLCARYVPFSVSCARRSNGPDVGATGPIRPVSDYQIMVFRQRKAPLDSGESTRASATDNDVNLRDL